jgi:hypothetical protein
VRASNLGHMYGHSGVGVVVFKRAECWLSFGAVRRRRISHGHQDTSPERPPVVELGHLFLIVFMTQNLKISGHPLMRTAEFTPSPRDDVVNLNAIGGATPHAPPSVEPQHKAAQ